MKSAVENRIWAALLAWVLTLGAFGCFLTVYDLPIQKNTLLLFWSGAAALGALLLPFRRGPEWTVCLTALALGYLVHRPETVRQMKSLLYLVSTSLDNVYHWGYFSFPGLVAGNTEIPLGIYGGLLCLAVCRSMLRRRLSVIPLTMTAPLVVLCAMIPGKDPAAWAVACLLSAAAMLLLTSGVRKNSALQGLRLTWAAAIPVLACVGLLLWCNPQKSYVDHSAQLREKLLAKAQTLTGSMPGYVYTPQISRNVDLAALNGGEQPRIPILTVTAPKTGSVYLRAQDFDTYTGTGWSAAPQKTENFDGWGEDLGTFSVRTFAVQDVIYLPYYPGTATILTGGALANTGGTLSYSFPTHPQGSALSQQALERYLALPESTLAWAREMLPVDASPEGIRQLVGGSAVYDLATPQMPQEEQDFVRWFLERSDRGYCIHFASAATVLLRAAGIPARYVTGYRQEVKANEPEVVTSREAHAWAEYYDGETGCWRILDATPAQNTQALEETTQTQPDVTRQTLPSAAAPTVPQEATPKQENRGGLPLGWLVIPALILGLAVRRALVRALRESRKRRSTARKRVLLLWQEAEVLSGASGRDIPEELLELAQKARFSQHRITAMDAVPLETFCQDCIERLQKASWGKRMIDQYIFVRY